MPKQIFQRPPPVPRKSNIKVKSGAPGQPEFGRKSDKVKRKAKSAKI